jgi:predicted DNA-binding protein (MmcQ/YjbR family)
MDVDQLKTACLGKHGVTADFPFGPETQVFRVMGKIFALIPLDASPRINLKCDPGWAELLRQTYPAVTPGYHMNKRHWNTVLCDGTISDTEIDEMIEHAYAIVVKGLKRAEREQLEKLSPNA